MKNVYAFRAFTFLLISDTIQSKSVLGCGLQYKRGIGLQNTKENEKIYNENTMGRHIQSMICQDDFMEDLRTWLFTIEDERILLARKFLFEVDLSDTEQLRDTLLPKLMNGEIDLDKGEI